MPKYGENIYHRKDGRWEARYIAMRLPNGKAKYKSVYGRTHDIAKKKQLAAMQALTHESTAACELTLKELFSQYLLQTDVKLSTRERYRFMLERHILPHLGGIPVSRLTAKELSSFLLWMKQHGRLHSGGGLSAKTVRDLAVLIKTLLRYAQREYHCVCDALNAKLPACTQKKIDVFSETELAALGKALFPSKKISLAVMLALHAGLRVGEVCALRVSDIDFLAGTLHVCRSVQRVTLHGVSQLLVQRPKSDSSERVVPLHSELLLLLRKITAGMQPDASRAAAFAEKGFREAPARCLSDDRPRRPPHGPAHLPVSVHGASAALRHPSPRLSCAAAHVCNKMCGGRRGYKKRQ